MTGEAKQEEALSKLPHIPPKTEVVKLKNVDMHMAAEQMFVPPLPLDSATRASTESASASSKHEIRDSEPELVCSGAAVDITWCFGESCLSDKTKCTCDGCLVQGHAR